MKIEAEKIGLICREITKEICMNKHYTLLEPGEDPHHDETAFTDFDKDMMICALS